MKKIYLSVIFLLFILCFSGCKSLDKGFYPVITDISFEAQINTNGESYSYNTVSDKNGNISFKALSPDDIKDFGYYIGKEKCEISFGEVSSVIEREETGPLGAIYEIFQFAKNNSNNAKADNDMYIISGEIDAGKFKMIFAESGIPISAEISNGTVIYFKNVKLKGL